MNYWLMKSEPEECSVDDVLAAKKSTVPWVGVRNYQARNFMRDSMQVGDGVLLYHLIAYPANRGMPYPHVPKAVIGQCQHLAAISPPFE